MTNAQDTPQSPVPFIDLSIQRDRIASEVGDGFELVLKNMDFVMGAAVTAFEAEFADFCDVSDVVGVGNGTDALEIALWAAGIGRGDEVVVPANTFVATAEAVLRRGAELVLVDCDDDFLMDPEALAATVTSRTRAVIPVHLYGQTARMEAIRAAVGDDVVVVEDAAQSQGARRNGVRAGGLGDVAATSFYPGKNLGAYGDAGAVMTTSSAYADRARNVRNHGGTRKYEHVEVGINSRLDSLQAVVLSAKLRQLDDWNAERRAAATLYGELLGQESRVVLPRVVEGNEHVFHLYVVRVDRRDEVLATLQEAGIGAGIHYPHPVHQLPAFADLGVAAGAYPRSETMAAEILSLPMFPGITAAQQERVAEVLTRALG